MQDKLDNEKSLEERRKFGQFSTPFALAREIADYGLSLLSEKEISFLEPCMGSGAFCSALLQTIQGSDYRLTTAAGIEIDPDYHACAQKIWEDLGFKLQQGDFTKIDPQHKYNFLLTNPPYVRHHYLTPEEKSYLLAREKYETKISMSALAGLYCHFILLAHKWLAPGAICGWLIPSEFMDVNYGSAIKNYLLNQVHLLRIHRYSPENTMFSEALVSSCVVWFKNERASDDYTVEFSLDGTHAKPQLCRSIHKSALMQEHKWTRFPAKAVRQAEDGEETLGDFFEIKRGLVTGDNDFFILSREKILELGLDMTFFKPVLPSPRYLKADLVDSDAQGFPRLDTQYFLLDCALDEPDVIKQSPATWAYLQSGLERTSKRYLCRKRKTWYFQEQRQSTRFLCSYMGRGKNNSSPIRFILNLSQAIVTNSYLMLYPKENLQQLISERPDSIYKLWDLLKKISAEHIEEEGRVYGGGLKKIEPGELARVRCGELLRLGC